MIIVQMLTKFQQFDYQILKSNNCEINTQNRKFDGTNDIIACKGDIIFSIGGSYFG